MKHSTLASALLAPTLLLALSLGACESSGTSGAETDTSQPVADIAPAEVSLTDASADATSDGASDLAPEIVADVADAVEDTGPTPDVVVPPALCADGVPVRAFDPGPGGVYRHDLAGDFDFERTDGQAWRFSEHWTGCDTYVFIPDTLTRTQLDPASAWNRDLPALLDASPDNVHYVFISRAPTDEAAAAAAAAMAERIIDAVIDMPADEGAHWLAHLHVTPHRAGSLGTWLQTVVAQGIGQAGFTIDRTQRIRGLGSLADVTRTNQAASAAGAWPFETNLAYASNDARYLNAEAAADHELAGEEATEIVLWDGEVLAEFAEIEVTLPSPEELAEFDTLHLDIDMRCPEPALPEPGNCGAWDYLAHLRLLGEEEGEPRIELGRFITAYHRETRWVSDVSPMLAHLQGGGTRTFRWDFAPSWNTQPTWTRLSLRFSKRDKGQRPVEAVPLYFGGSFGLEYNTSFEPLEVPIPADATRVELYSVITGHGADTSQCAEFCNHAHEFTVNGQTWFKDHPTVGLSTGCVPELARRMVPNQHGTWWYGRGGWCPGQHVTPWIVDITDVAAPGTTASISYRGLLNGAEPPANAGNIVMSSFMVVYR